MPLYAIQGLGTLDCTLQQYVALSSMLYKLLSPLTQRFNAPYQDEIIMTASDN